MIQLRFNVQITHLHTDAGSAFLKLGDTAKVSTGQPQQGEYLRLFVMLQTIKMGEAKGQYGNVVESFVKRLKQLWRTSRSFLEKLEGYSMIELDFLLELMCGQLNHQPLDPDQSDICPGDFLMEYRAIPTELEYHDGRSIKSSFEKVRKAYEEMKKAQKNNRFLTLFVWKVKRTVRVKKEVR